jgi:hypothetical protein
MKSFIEKLEKTFMAATFAEADCHEMAKEYMDGVQPKGGSLEEFLDTVGLGGVRYSYVVASL